MQSFWHIFEGTTVNPGYGIVLLLGLIIGSFLNVCIYRIPRKTFWQSSRSRCPHCQAEIPIIHNIPILSYLFLRGRAACCKQKISIQYPLVELLTVLIAMSVYWRFPFIQESSGFFKFNPLSFVYFSHAYVFAWILIICSVIDFQHMIIPDVISLPMIAMTPLVVLVHPGMTWTNALLGVAIGGGSLYLLAWIYWLVRREIGLGFGDVKLLAGIGGWLGYQAILPTIFYGSIIGSIIGITLVVTLKKYDLKSALPFGPFLAIGAWIHLMYGSYINKFIFGLYS